MTTKLENMGLGERASAVMKAAGLLNAEDIAARTEVEVLALNGVDQEVIEEVASALDMIDLKFATESAVAEHPLLSRAEVDEIRKQARQEIEDARRVTAKKELLKAEKQKLREDMGLYVGGPADELVYCTLDLAEHSPFLQINTTRYYHGATYKVPRHVADTLREMQARGHRHQDEIDGKSLTQHYQRNRNTSLSPKRGISNAPQRAA